jgi:hypothetical protein
LKQRIFKPVVFFLDSATLVERMIIMERIRPVLNGMDLDDVLSQPHLVVTNLSRNGERLDYYLVRCSRCHPHFYNRDCYKDAIVYGESDYIGPLEDLSTAAITTMMRHQIWRDVLTATEVLSLDKVKIGELK